MARAKSPGAHTATTAGGVVGDKGRVMALERQNFLLRKKLLAHQHGGASGTKNAYGLHANVI